tara:strand:+ start:25989 stop:26657 length:669 start_codon:yes stop_codon:yes gene_type:complete
MPRTPEEQRQLWEKLKEMEAIDDATLMDSLDETQPMEFEPSSSVERMESQIIPATAKDDRGLAIGLQNSMKYKKHFDASEAASELPPGILIAIATIESNGDPAAIGPETKSGQAKGLMQFMPATAGDYELVVDAERNIDERLDPIKSIYAAGKMLRASLIRSDGDIGQALIQYNWGAGNWDRWKKKEKGYESIPAETAAYIGRFRSALNQYQRMSDTEQVAR